MNAALSSYLKEESFYTDQYDIHTIEECLRRVELWRKAMSEKTINGTLPSDELITKAINIFLYFLKGD